MQNNEVKDPRESLNESFEIPVENAATSPILLEITERNNLLTALQQNLHDLSGTDDDVSEVESFVLDADDFEDAESTLDPKFLLPSESMEADLHSVDPETQARLEALLEAAGIGKLSTPDGKALADPEVLRRLTSSVSYALDEAAQALTRMRNEQQGQNPNIQADRVRSLAEACSDGDITTVRKLLDEGRSVHETTEDGESLLSLACSAGYFELVQVLLAMRANVEDRGIKGDCTPLMEAASGGHVDIVRLLIRNNADVNAQSSSGNTALHYAACGGYEDVVLLLIKANANVEEHNENGHTPLMEAASAGHVEIAKVLLENGAGINTHSNEFKESALTLACYKGHLEMVKFLLEAGADQEHKTDEMHTALMEASMDGHVEVARLLLDSGAQVNMPPDSFESPLTLAACGGHVELANLLIERGANLEEVNDEGYTPLMEAAREGHEEMVALLLAHGADINAQTEETQETALTLACCGGFHEVADFLIKAGADIEHGCSTPLMEASQEGHLELVKYLIKAGANINAQTGTGDTALTYACENGHTDVADILLQHGADLEHESEGGRTPLMKAARAGHLCTVQFLISKNADVNRQTSTNDHTVLSLACAGGHLRVVELLLESGSDQGHALKDGSTMLIEAAKGGHTAVVNLLLDNQGSLSPPRDIHTPEIIENLNEINESPRVPTHGLSNMVPRQDPDQVPLPIQPMVEEAELEAAAANLFVNEKELIPSEKLKDVQKASLRKKTLRDLITDDSEFLEELDRKFATEGGASGSSDSDATEDLQSVEKGEKLQLFIHNMLEKAETLTSTREEQITRRQQIVEELQKVERELQEKAQAQMLLSVSQEYELQRGSGDASLTTAEGQRQTPVGQASAIPLPPVPMQSVTTAATEVPNTLPANINAREKKKAKRSKPVAQNQPTPPSLPVTTSTTALAADPAIIQPSLPLGAVLPLTMSPQVSLPGGDGAASHDVPTSMQQAQVSSALYTGGEFIVNNNETDGSEASGSLEGVLPLLNSVPLHLEHRVASAAAVSLLDQQLQQESQQLQANLELQKQLQAELQQQLRLQQEYQQLEKQLTQHRQHLNGSEAGSAQVKSLLTPEKREAMQRQVNLLREQQQQVALQAAALQCAANQQQTKQHVEHQEKLKQLTQQIKQLQASQLSQTELKELLQKAQQLQQHTQCQQQQQLEHFREQQMQYHTNMIATSQSQAVSHQQLMLHLQQQLRQAQQLAQKQQPPPPSVTAQPKKLKKKNGNGKVSNIPALDATQAPCDDDYRQVPMDLTPPCSGPQTPNPSPASPTLDSQMHFSCIDLDAQTESNHDTALTLACAGGHAELVNLLLSRGADIEHRDKKGFTPLILAATAGHTEVVESLLDNGADIEAQSERTKDTPLSLACSGGRYEVVDLLLQKGANKEHRNVSDYTPLSLAASGGYVNIIQLLLGSGAEINSRTGSKLGISPLMLAAMNGHTSAVKLLLDRGSDINAQIETNRNTALTLACFQGRHEVVSLLVDRKANIEHRAKTGLTPLMEAASGGYVEVGRVLLEKGADVNAPPVPSSRDTALTIAADKGHLRFVDLLLKHHAAVDVKNKKGNSPLWLACNGGHLDVVQLLVHHAADVDSQDNRKVTCLMAAYRKAHVKVVKWLVRHVTQFPSDQECMRYIATITSDKDLLKKCHQCMEIIVTAKDRQAAEANKNATILLEEIDQERSREESKKAAMARKREKRKRKKKEKQEKEKELNPENSTKPNNETGQSQEDEDEENRDSKSCSPEPTDNISQVENENLYNKNDGVLHNNNESNEENLQKKERNDRSSRNKQKRDRRGREASNALESSRSKDKSASKSITPPELIKSRANDRNISEPQSASRVSNKADDKRNQTEREKAERTGKISQASTPHKSSPQQNGKTPSSGRKNKKEKRTTGTSGGMGDLDDFSLPDSFEAMQIKDKHNKKTSQKAQKPVHIDTVGNYLSPGKNVSNKVGSIISPKRAGQRKDDGWKEVTRKPVVSKSKKITIPAHAISRVIGRGGSNINAIREQSGATIELDNKKSTTTEDRVVTIKGSVDAIRQASNLIMGLVKDPDGSLTFVMSSTSNVWHNSMANHIAPAEPPVAISQPPTNSQPGTIFTKPVTTVSGKIGSGMVTSSAPFSAVLGGQASSQSVNKVKLQNDTNSQISPRAQVNKVRPQGSPSRSPSTVSRQLFPGGPAPPIGVTTAQTSVTFSTMSIASPKAPVTKPFNDKQEQPVEERRLGSAEEAATKENERRERIAATLLPASNLMNAHQATVTSSVESRVPPMTAVSNPSEFSPFNTFNAFNLLGKRDDQETKMNFASVAAAPVKQDEHKGIPSASRSVGSMEHERNMAMIPKANMGSHGSHSNAQRIDPASSMSPDPGMSSSWNYQASSLNAPDPAKAPGYKAPSQPVGMHHSQPHFQPQASPLSSAVPFQQLMQQQKNNNNPPQQQPNMGIRQQQLPINFMGNMAGSGFDLHQLYQNELSAEYSTPHQPMTLPKIESTLNPNAPDFTYRSMQQQQQQQQQQPQRMQEQAVDIQHLGTLPMQPPLLVAPPAFLVPNSLGDLTQTGEVPGFMAPIAPVVPISGIAVPSFNRQSVQNSKPSHQNQKIVVSPNPKAGSLSEASPNSSGKSASPLDSMKNDEIGMLPIGSERPRKTPVSQSDVASSQYWMNSELGNNWPPQVNSVNTSSAPTSAMATPRTGDGEDRPASVPTVSPQQFFQQAAFMAESPDSTMQVPAVLLAGGFSAPLPNFAPLGPGGSLGLPPVTFATQQQPTNSAPMNSNSDSLRNMPWDQNVSKFLGSGTMSSSSDALHGWGQPAPNKMNAMDDSAQLAWNRESLLHDQGNSAPIWNNWK